MGFSGIVSTMIMFIAVVAISVTVVGAFNNMADQTATSIQIQGDYLADSLKTDLYIETVSYNNLTDVTTINVRNSGKTKLDIDKTDVYIDGLFIPRNDTNRTITIQSTTDIRNVGIWDPDEVVEIRVFKTLTDGDHVATITTQYAAKEEDTFSVVEV